MDTTTFSIGIDIGGTNTDIGLVSAEGKCVQKSRLRTDSYFDVDLYVNDLLLKIHELLNIHGVDRFRGIGIGAPNGNFFTGSIEYAPNLHFKGVVNLQKMIQDKIDTKVVLTNDANAAAYGEMIYGGAKNMKDFIMITLGTGIGSGIVIDGKMLYGHDGFAGELGHTLVYPGGRLCTCGRKGCLEQYVAVRGIVQTCHEMMQELNYTGSLASIPKTKLGLKNIGDAARKGDHLAHEVLMVTANILGIALSNAVAFSSPEAIFLMGGPTKVGNVLIEAITKSFEEHLLAIYKGHVKILLSELDENNAAILGAAALVN